MMDKTHSRYPITYAYDYVRSFGGYAAGGVKLSRSDAGQVVQAIADAVGMDKQELCVKLADYYMANEQAISDKSVREMMIAIGVEAPIKGIHEEAVSK